MGLASFNRMRKIEAEKEKIENRNKPEIYEDIEHATIKEEVKDTNEEEKPVSRRMSRRN